MHARARRGGGEAIAAAAIIAVVMLAGVFIMHANNTAPPPPPSNPPPSTTSTTTSPPSNGGGTSPTYHVIDSKEFDVKVPDEYVSAEIRVHVSHDGKIVKADVVGDYGDSPIPFASEGAVATHDFKVKIMFGDGYVRYDDYPLTIDGYDWFAWVSVMPGRSYHVVVMTYVP